ncbi:type II secretion system F family protein [Trujillonella endophytica]|uniref:Type II secretion system (T2SS), protein F n=1 Tax=Trujillonella endophytica TaxID=673521 RepID=A0A1H8WJT6_9ACTN|nr:type II secretion system F family protein [Trujillella endophytica]SEP27892.1 Type II secretion system (T2SS), protein F [Trujillella endophytica]
MSVGASLAAGCAAAAAALVLWAPSPGPARARALARGPAEAARTAADDLAGRTRRRLLLAAGSGSGTALVAGGVLGLVVGVAVAVGVDRLLRRSEEVDARRVHAGLEDELPIACDLLAVCLSAGLPVGGALESVAAALTGPLGTELAAVGGRYRLGSAALAAWAGVPGPVAGLGRVMARAGESGSSVVPALRALATDSRAELRARTEARVRAAGVWVLAPLGACFLPAFVCLGVAPMVLGIAADVLP